MRNITARKKFAALFSLTVFGIIVIFSVFFIAIFIITQYSQVKKEVYLELDNVNENHLAINNNSLTFVKDSTGESLRQHLASTNISVAIYSIEFKAARTYGIFVYQGNLIDKKNPLFPIFDKTKKEDKTQDGKLVLNDEEYFIVTTPIKSPSGETLGFMALAENLSPIYSSFSNLVSISMALAILSLIVSFWIGLLLMRAAYSNLKEISYTISKIDLNKLHHRLEEKGHKDDEVFILAKKFNEMVDRLIVATQKQKEFVSNASHKLKTPIARIISSIDTIDEENVRINPDIKNIRQQLFSMAETVEELLLLAKLREHNPKEGVSNVSKVIDSVQNYNKQNILDKNMTISSSLDKSLLLPMPETYARIIFSNLIVNAIKFGDNNSRIEIFSKPDTAIKSVSIKNYGKSIPDEDRDRIFDRFYRSGKSRQTNGIGIGLAIVKSLCDMYFVEINAESNDSEKSTTFTLAWKI